MIDIYEFARFLLERKAGRSCIPQSEVFFWATKRNWERKDVTSALKHLNMNGKLAISTSFDVILNFTSASEFKINVKEEPMDPVMRRFKKKDHDAYLHQKELKDWTG